MLVILTILTVAWAAPRDPRCPYENEDDTARLIPHESDCEKFYTCHANGTLIEMQCKDELEFDPELLVNCFFIL